MAWTEIAGNTTTLTGSGTEDAIIAAQTAAGMYVVAADLSNMVNGDAIEIRVYTKVRTGATARVIARWYFNNAQAEANWQSPAVFVGTGDVAVKMVQSAGTGRAVITSLIGDPGGLEPTTAGRKLDVSTGGEAGLDWANVGSPTTTLNLSATTVGVAAALTANNDKTGYRLSATGVDDVWDEALSGHTTSGTSGKALADAGTAGDPWATALPGSYTSGQAGKLVGDNINSPLGAIKTVVDAIKAITDVLISPATIATAVWASATRLLTAGTNIVLAKGTGVTGFTDLSASDVRTAVGLGSANLDTQLGNALTAINALNDLSIADILGMVYEDGETFQEHLRLVRAVTYGRSSGHPLSPVFKAEDDATPRVSATLDASGNRTAITLDPS